ncbi:MAG TPA: hypothetical protein VM692_02805, partial [Gammaproteobacteria bacterium]|nr:hypothetical protein [Gammaproteobacteria bacterium]
MRTSVVLSAGLLAALGAAAQCAAATLEVSVVDDEGKPIVDVAVYATAHSAELGATGVAAEASGPAPT